MKRLIDSAGNARQSASSKPLAARKEMHRLDSIISQPRRKDQRGHVELEYEPAVIDRIE